ncbi:MAG: oligopeptide/dipeptide ABC transporter ATP-binding protein [Paenalcaligenes sp.]
MTQVALLEGRKLQKTYRRKGVFTKGTEIRAVEEISLSVASKETVAVVGESGCGKSTTAKMLLGLEELSAGGVYFEGEDLAGANADLRRRYRSGVQAVFQDPWSSLNPRMRVYDIIAEPMLINGFDKAHIDRAVYQSLDEVGLEKAAANNFPHEFSGGQRQRIAIARAVALRPRAIVLDEPVSALDVSVRAQIMNLLKDLQQSLGMGYVLISHDLATVRFLATRVVVMYKGRIVEQGESEALFRDPKHPYTARLIEAARIRKPGDITSAAPLHNSPPAGMSKAGCMFAERCPVVMQKCWQERPELLSVATDYEVACHRCDVQGSTLS